MDDGYEDVGSFDYHPNALLRGTKGTLFEGGHRVPFLARWPGHIRAGSTSSALIAHLDMPATLAALVGAKIPVRQCVDSVNILPALLGNSSVGRADFVAHVGGTQGPFALRAGDYKYISAGAQLYDLKADLAEERNLAEAQPDKLNEIQTFLAKIRGTEK